MAVKLSQLSSPLATFFFIIAVNKKTIEWLFESLVRKVTEFLLFATRTWFVVGLDAFNALFTEALSTACSLVGLSENK